MSDNPRLNPLNIKEVNGQTFTGPNLPIVVRPDAYQVDGFYRQRLAIPESLVWTIFEYNASPLIFDPIINGTGSAVNHISTDSCVELTSGTVSGNYSQIQSHLPARYSGARSQQFNASFVMGSAVTGLIRHVGAYWGTMLAPTDGIVLEQSSGVLTLKTYRNGSVTHSAAQSTWNRDKLDGTGSSGVTLDVQYINRMTFDFQFSGKVRFFFSIGGSLILAHEASPTNVQNTALIGTPNLPHRFGIYNTGTLGASPTMRVYIPSSITEGGADPLGIDGYSFTADRGASFRQVTPSAYTPLLTIRPKATFSSKANHGIVVPTNIGILSETRLVNFALIKGNPVSAPVTLTGATFTASVYGANGTHSMVEYDTDATAISGGLRIYSGQIQNNDSISSIPTDVIRNAILAVNQAGGQDTLTLVAITNSGGNTNCLGSIGWKEIY